MHRFIRLTTSSVAIALALAGVADAQVRIGPRGPEPTADSRQPDRDAPRRVTIIVGPHAAEPQPPLKYALYPRLQERTPGNSETYWYRALLTVVDASARGGFKSFYDNLDRWFECPISEMPLDEVRPFVERYASESFGSAYGDARIASLRQDMEWDWHIEQFSGMESIEFHLHDAQECRSLARLLILKARLEIAERRYDDALKTLQICYRLGEDLGKTEIIISQLVGMAVTALADVTVLELIRAPDSPNLYWALAARPRPLFDVRKSAEFEVTLSERMVPEVMQAATHPRSSAEWQRFYRESLKAFAPLGNTAEYWPANDAPQVQWDALVAGLSMLAYPNARRDLVNSGMTAGEVDAMPVGQALAEHQARDLVDIRQEMLKWCYVPANQGRAPAHEAFDRLNAARRLPDSPWEGRTVLPIAGLLMPAINQFLEASERRERFLNMLLALEAVRMQIAHDGKLPATLADVTIVPVPEDRYTDAPFVYSEGDGHAILDLRLHAKNARMLDWEIELRVAGE